MSNNRLRGPAQIRGVFLAVMLLLASTLGLLAWRLIADDQKLSEKLMDDQREATAGQTLIALERGIGAIERVLDQMLAEDGDRLMLKPPPGAVYVAMRKDAVRVWLDDIAWFANNSQTVAHPVGEKLPNAWGLHDVLGNVWEWTQDWYGVAYYTGSPVSDPSGPILYDASRGKVARGGGFNFNRTGTRTSHRREALPGGVGPAVGFRLVRERTQ